MKVTNIKPQVKRANRYSIFLDNKYAFSLDESELLDLKLKVGQEVKAAELSKINDEAVYSKAKNACYRLLSYRSRSSGEIKDYLVRKKYEPDTIDRVINYLTSKAFLNDEEFAKQWIENRISNKKASIRQIKLELRQKKVDSEIVNKIFENEDVDEVELIKQLIEKKRTQPKYKDDLKLMQFLARRGFSYDKILTALGRRAE